MLGALSPPWAPTAGCPSSPVERQPTLAPLWVPSPPGTGYLRVAVEPGGVQPGIVGTLDVGSHQCQVPAFLPGGRDVAQVHVWGLQALQALSMKEDEISPPPAFTGLPMAWCPPPTHTHVVPQGPGLPFQLHTWVLVAGLSRAGSSQERHRQRQLSRGSPCGTGPAPWASWTLGQFQAGTLPMGQ